MQTIQITLFNCELNVTGQLLKEEPESGLKQNFAIEKVELTKGDLLELIESVNFEPKGTIYETIENLCLEQLNS